MKHQHIKNPTAKITLVFLHGWCGAPEDFNNQIKFFSKKYEILSLNYSSLILEEKLDSQQLFSSCLNIIAETIKKHTNKPIILIGQSMGGMLALCLAENFKKQLITSVIIDSTMPQPISAQAEKLLRQLNSPAGEKIFEKLISTVMVNKLFDNTLLMKNKILAMLDIWRQKPKTATDLLEEALLLEKTSYLEKLKSPLLYISCEPARGDIDAIKKLKPDTQIKHIQSGHFVMLNQPEKLNELLENFINQHT